jgi:spore photoproduct lyase
VNGNIQKNSPLNSTTRATAIRRVQVARDCLDLAYTREILARLDGRSVEVIPTAECERVPVLPDAGAFRQGKETLLLCRQKGRFLKKCPGTRVYECCGYQVLNVGMNCPMDCVYCILQAYLNNPRLSFFVNVEDLFTELAADIADDPKRYRRIGTGEFTDSLVLDPITGLSRLLVDFFRSQPRAVLELKTKSAAIANLLELDHNGRTIVSWSLNSPLVTNREELFTATLDDRLAAAAHCAAAGYRVGFHFDPIIYHPGWQQGYSEIIDRLFQTVRPEHIVWISLGCLRFLPALRSIATERFPGSSFFHEEFIEGLDGKFRYFRSLRVEMYRFLARKILAAAPECCLYLCMESEEIWQEVFQFTTKDRGGLTHMLDAAAFDL